MQHCVPWQVSPPQQAVADEHDVYGDASSGQARQESMLASSTAASFGSASAPGVETDVSCVAASRADSASVLTVDASRSAGVVAVLPPHEMSSASTRALRTERI
jgi:hypothetical protein